MNSDAGRGLLVSALLAGSWRAASSAPNLSEAELTEIAPLLCQTGSAALGWWRIRGQRSEAAMLHEAYRKFRLSARIHEQEIKYVFSLLRAEGIEPVLVKGWAVARHYPDRGLRPYGDIDLCVRPDQFAKAEHILRCLENIDGHYVDLHSGFAKLDLECGDWSPLFRLGIKLDRLGRKRLDESGDKSPHSKSGAAHAATLWDELFERSQLVSMGEEKIRVLSDEDHLRILCLHLLRSGAWRPLWLCDVAIAFETRAADFNWERCLSTDPKIAEWVACTIGVAQQLLGAEDRSQKSEVRYQKSEVRDRDAGSGKREAESEKWEASLPLPLTPYPFPFARELPRWLVPAILRQWGRAQNPHALEMALPALSARTRDVGKLFKEIYARWDQPVRATVAVRGRFNNWPRWPYQLGELLLHSPEVPKQLATMIRRLVNPKTFESSAQSQSLGFES